MIRPLKFHDLVLLMMVSSSSIWNSVVRELRLADTETLSVLVVRSAEPRTL